MARTSPTLLYQCFLADRKKYLGLVHRRVSSMCWYELKMKYCCATIPLQVALKDSNEENSSRDQSFEQYTWILTS